MGDNLALALQERWWVERRNRPPVQNALVTAHSRFWRPQVEAALAANGKQHREPSNWAKLAEALAMDEPNLWRRRTGGSKSTLRDLLAMATILQVSIHQLVPDAPTWIEQATLILCAGTISPEEARAYTLYRLGGATCHNPHLDQAAIADIRRQIPGCFASSRDAEAAILKTAARLGERLGRGA